MRESGKRPAARQLRGSQPLISEHSAGTEGLPPIGAAAHWHQTLWAMVGIQFVMTAAFSMLTPIMPLFLPVLGVESEAAIDIWAGVLNGVTSLVARSEEHTSELQSRVDLVCRLLLEKKKTTKPAHYRMHTSLQGRRPLRTR